MWDISQNRRVIFGAGMSGQIGQLVKSFAVSRVFVSAYDTKAASVKAIMQSITDQGIAVYADDSIKGEPSISDIDRLFTLVNQQQCQGVVAIGGGSVMDAAKAVAMIATNGGLVEQYQMEGKPVTRPGLPLIAVPTTAGTGSEATRVSVVYNHKNGLKKSFYSPLMIADAVVLDPNLTLSLPPEITVSTGVDALSHAIESYVSLNATPYTEMYGLKAMELILPSLPRCVADGSDVAARSDMLLASFFAGCALNAGIGLAHMIAQPLGGLLKIPHGVACAIYLPYAMQYNVAHSTRKYCDIARKMGVKSTEDSLAVAMEGIERVQDYLRALKAPTRITAWLTDDFKLDDAVQSIMGATSHIKCNPRAVDVEAIRLTVEQTL
jgi:alcohol dehydrogenase class IV